MACLDFSAYRCLSMGRKHKEIKTVDCYFNLRDLNVKAGIYNYTLKPGSIRTVQCPCVKWPVKQTGDYLWYLALAFVALLQHVTCLKRQTIAVSLSNMMLHGRTIIICIIDYTMHTGVLFLLSRNVAFDFHISHKKKLWSVSTKSQNAHCFIVCQYFLTLQLFKYNNRKCTVTF